MRQLALFALILAVGAYFLTVGQWALIAGLMVIILGHELGHWFVARMFGISVPVFSIGFLSQPRLTLGTLWGTEFRITPWLAGGYVQIDPNSDDFTQHSAWKRVSVLLAGVTMNVIMAVVFMIAAYTFVGKPIAHVTVSQVSSEHAAAAAGLQPGDELISVDGRQVTNANDVIARVHQHQPGSPLVVVVSRQQQQMTFRVSSEGGAIGIALAQRNEFKPVGLVEATTRGASDAWFITRQTAEGFAMMTGLVAKPHNADTNVHGIVGIVQVGGAAYNAGMFSFIWLLAALNINLLFLNILPMPLLDGGHVAYIAWEKLTGKRVSLDWQGKVALVSLVLLGSLMVFGLWNDIMHPILGG